MADGVLLADGVPYGGWAAVLGEASVFLSVDKGSGAEFLPSWSIPL